MEISFGNKKVREVRALCDKSSVRRKTGLFVIEGERLCAEAPRDAIVETYISKSYLQAHPDAAYDYLLKNGDFEHLADTRHPQGILCVVRQTTYDLREFLDGDLYLVLETIQDPGNLGTIIRTAEAAGVKAVIMNKGCADIYSPKVVRSTMGSIFRLPFVYADELSKAVLSIKPAGVTVYAASLGGENINEIKLAGRRAFMIGNEGAGLTDYAIGYADKMVSIPMSGQVESLNAAISTAILLYKSD